MCDGSHPQVRRVGISNEEEKTVPHFLLRHMHLKFKSCYIATAWARIFQTFDFLSQWNDDIFDRGSTLVTSRYIQNQVHLEIGFENNLLPPISNVWLSSRFSSWLWLLKTTNKGDKNSTSQFGWIPSKWNQNQLNLQIGFVNH